MFHIEKKSYIVILFRVMLLALPCMNTYSMEEKSLRMFQEDYSSLDNSVSNLFFQDEISRINDKVMIIEKNKGKIKEYSALKEAQKQSQTDISTIFKGIWTFFNGHSEEKVFHLTYLPSELRQHIMGFLPGNDCGLNWLARLREFKPRPEIKKTIEAAFLRQLNKQGISLSEPLAYAMMHFFETTQYKKSSLNSFSKESKYLDRVIPFYEKKNWWDVAPREFVARLDKDAIKSGLKRFVEATPVQADNLYAENKTVITFADLCKIRRKFLNRLAERLDECVYSPPFNVGVLIPGAVCCACGGISTAVGCVLCNIVPTAGALIGTLGGCGCSLLGLVNLCLGVDPTCDDCYIQRIHKDPCSPGYEINEWQKCRINALKEIIDKYAQFQGKPENFDMVVSIE